MLALLVHQNVARKSKVRLGEGQNRIFFYRMIPQFTIVFLALLLAACSQPPLPTAGPGDPPVIPELARAAGEGHPVLFVGLDGADWEILDPYIQEGRMPNLAALSREGRTGILTTIQPPVSPLVWTTEMTGVSPLEHGILDFTRFHPKTGEREPIPREERRVPAVWNMASAAGQSVAVFGLWATWPAEPVRGLLVADRFSSFTASGPPPAGSVYPQDQEAWTQQILERAEREVDLAALRTYVPDLTEEEFRAAASRPDPYVHPVSALRRILVETRAYDTLARTWISEHRPDLSIVYFQGTDTIGHVFAPPPRAISSAPVESPVSRSSPPCVASSGLSGRAGGRRSMLDLWIRRRVWYSPWKLSVGASAYYRTGTPVTRYGYSDIYGRYEFFLTHRGAEGRTPDNYEADLHLGYPVAVGPATFNFLVDVFNVLNAQKAILVDQRWGFQEADNASPTPVNPGYKRPVLRTPPTSFRLGVRVSF